MASKTYIGDLYGTASLDTRHYMAGLAAMRTRSAATFAALAGTVKKAVGIFLAIQGGRAFTGLATETLRTVAAIDKLSQTTGIAAQDLQAYAKASEFAGDTEINLQRTFSELARKRIDAIRGNRELRRTFSDLNLSADDLKMSLGGELFEKVIDGLSRIDDHGLRAATAFKLFGGQAEQVNGLLIQGAGAFARARAEIERTGAALSREDLAQVRVASEALGDLSDAWQVFKTRLTVALTPLIYQVSNIFTDLLSNPKRLEEVVGAITGIVEHLTTIAVTLPTRIGIAWRELYIGALKVKRLMDGGITGLLNPETQAATEQIRQLEAELTELRKTLDIQLKSDPSGFFAKVQKALADIGTITAVGNAGPSPALERLRQDLERVQSTIEDGLSESLANLFIEGKAGFRELGQVILRELVTALIRAQIVTPILDAVGLGAGAGAGGLLGSAFGGYRASGGAVEAGRAYIVGEKRPELFVPRSAGTIRPDASSAMRGMRGGDTYHIDARGADSAAIARLEQMILALNGSIENRSVAAVYDATRRGRLGFG
jgi:hypothetical protein